MLSSKSPICFQTGGRILKRSRNGAEKKNEKKESFFQIGLVVVYVHICILSRQRILVKKIIRK